MKKVTKIVVGVMGLMVFCMLSAIFYGKTAQAETVIPLGDTWTGKEIRLPNTSISLPFHPMAR